MTRWQGVGTWLVIGGIVAATGIGFRHIGHDAQAASPALGMAALDAKPVLRMTRAMANGQQPIHLDAEMARRALRDGALQVVLPDGTSYRVQMERQETHGGGHWSVVGRVQTAAGSQAMVLTFGPNAVFGMLPTPDGHAMQVETHPGGLVTVAPAGGLTPLRTPLRRGSPDYRIPPIGPEAESQNDLGGTWLAAADRPIRLETYTGDTASTTQRTTLTAPAAAATPWPVDTTPVEITVLAMYSPELVALRGSQSAAETEVANLFAIAAQAHIDSGSRVRLKMVGLQEVALPATKSNEQVLDIMTKGVDLDTGTYIDFEAKRDDHEADLAAYIRPHSAELDADSCGASWLNGAGYAGPNGLSAAHGYVVANVAPCGQYVLAHELGHAMGSAHDKAAQRDENGVISHGAFAFSFDLKTDGFATIMADPGEGPWLGRFSSPEVACNGIACGEAERIDNVRSLNLMAPAIAAFRGPKGTIAIADTISYEGKYISFPIRLSAPAPEGGVQVHVDITGGTADPLQQPRGDYYDSNSHDLTIPAGQREAFFTLLSFNDNAGRPPVVEPDETILVHLTAPDGYTVEKADAVALQRDDDPRPVITLNIRAPAGVTLPDMFLIEWTGDAYDDDATKQEHISKTEPGLWSIQLPVAPGAPFRFRMDYALADEVAYTRVAQLDEVWEDRIVDVTLERTLRVTGTINVAAGMIRPLAEPQMAVHQYVNGEMRKSDHVWIPDPTTGAFEFRAIPGATLEMYVEGTNLPVDGNTLPFATWSARIQDVRSDFTLNPTRSSVQSVLGRPLPVAEGQDAVVEFERYVWPLPSTPITLTWHTVDGTAKAGAHYVAASGTVTIDPEELLDTIRIKTLENTDNTPGRKFDVVVDSVVGGVMFQKALHVGIANDDGKTGGKGQVDRK
ncbi:M12 family metallo-peptidase [Lysobacter sp. A6]|uniref:M12 family metallo-peptidase n=1 Tax=Noviluteimonas lactosilytica TaxID=2888523 RepID=A0ABS8JJS6_9GAMM|nr:M12 family metallo-peptidase [Lysobacter lactosilyticus]MCC8363857.1 M12 family metallo-peptidase [Lysobacter lactosilyticus]